MQRSYNNHRNKIVTDFLRTHFIIFKPVQTIRLKSITPIPPFLILKKLGHDHISYTLFTLGILLVQYSNLIYRNQENYYKFFCKVVTTIFTLYKMIKRSKQLPVFIIIRFDSRADNSLKLDVLSSDLIITKTFVGLSNRFVYNPT